MLIIPLLCDQSKYNMTDSKNCVITSKIFGVESSHDTFWDYILFTETYVLLNCGTFACDR